jgi:hypothetical protein
MYRLLLFGRMNLILDLPPLVRRQLRQHTLQPAKFVSVHTCLHLLDSSHSTAYHKSRVT